VTRDPAAADAIVGPQRRAQLIEAYADRLVLDIGMSFEQARRYAASIWPDVTVLIGIGQVWRRIGDARRGDMPPLSGDSTEEVTIEAIDRWSGMVDVGQGRHLNLTAYLTLRYELVAWPPECPAVPPEPLLAPAASLPQPEEQGGSDDEEEFSPHQLFVLAHRNGPPQDDDGHAERPHGPRWLPILADHFQSVPTRCPGCYMVWLDTVAYLRTHLADYRVGWPDWLDLWRPGDVWEYFNEWGRGFVTDIEVAAYLGHWLWARIRAHVVAEHGPQEDGYSVVFMWAGHMADAIIDAYPYADPRRELPPDHELMQGPGQLSLLDQLEA
jgi:hypothetical protein